MDQGLCTTPEIRDVVQRPVSIEASSKGGKLRGAHVGLRSVLTELNDRLSLLRSDSNGGIIRVSECLET